MLSTKIPLHKQAFNKAFLARDGIWTPAFASSVAEASEMLGLTQNAHKYYLQIGYDVAGEKKAEMEFYEEGN